MTGCKTGTILISVPQIRKVPVFVTRLESYLLLETQKEYVPEFIGDECSVVKLVTRYPSYSSFMVTCDFKHLDSVLNPEEWQQGVLVRQFYGKTINQSDDSNGGLSSD